MTSATAPEPVLAVADQCIDLGYSCANIESSGITLPTEPFPDMAVDLEHFFDAEQFFDLEHFFDLCIADDTVSTTDAAANNTETRKYSFDVSPNHSPSGHSTTPTVLPAQKLSPTIPYELKLAAFLHSRLGLIERHRIRAQWSSSNAAAQHRETSSEKKEGDECDEDPAAGVKVLREETATTRRIRAGRQMRASGG